MDLVSTAQLLGNFGEFFGSIAVVVTLIFLTFQMRQNTTETRNSSIQSIHAWRTGTVPSEVMDAMDERIRVWIDVPGWEQRWRYAARLHTESFRQHVDELAGR